MIRRILPLLTVATMAACSTSTPTGLVSVDHTGFTIDGKPYTYVGTNFWYAPILASDTPFSDRERLAQELDRLQSLGVDNLRILAGAEGFSGLPCHIEPILQTAPGVYDSSLLEGLDYLLADLERRGMKAVIYLTNAWEWSGGFSTYLQWAGSGDAPIPAIDGYQTYVDYVKDFTLSDSAMNMLDRHISTIVGRTNSVTGKPYRESPAIMSWQIANEPRPFSDATKETFAQWISHTAALIKSIDPNHLVSTGSEGLYGCHVDIELWRRIHSDPNVDYANIHIWPYNWRWVDESNFTDSVELAIKHSQEYIDLHSAIADSLGIPLVAEEFGYPRDNMEYAPGTPTSARDRYYRHVISQVGSKLAGCNFWGWGGQAVPNHTTWQPGDPYTTDPAHEPQGFYSVFDSDTSTIDIIRRK